jgi:hypothetical protein
MTTPELRLVQKLYAVVDRVEMNLFLELVPLAKEVFPEPLPPLSPGTSAPVPPPSAPA